MTLTVNLYYTGQPGAAQAFVKEMTDSGTVAAIRQQPGNLRYEYFQPLDDLDTILLIDQWVSQEALDQHHASPLMGVIAQLREKHDLHMRMECFAQLDDADTDSTFIRK